MTVTRSEDRRPMAKWQYDEEVDGTKEESGMEECNNNTTAVDGGEKHRVETSFVESTASQNDLHAVG